MAESLPSEGGGTEGTFPPSGDPPSILDLLGGEPGLLEHIFTFLPKGSFKSDDLVPASRSVGRWLQVSQQANQLDAQALWTTLQKSYFPNAPTPQTGVGYTARGHFVEMFHRHRHFAAARILCNRLDADFAAAVANEQQAAHLFNNTRPPSMATLPNEEQVAMFRRIVAAYHRTRRQKWEIGQSLHAAKSDLSWRASFLFDWNPAMKTVPIHRQNGGVLP